MNSVSDADFASIEEFYDKLIQFYQGRNIDNFIGMYTDDALWMFRGKWEDSGKPQAREFYEQGFTRGEGKDYSIKFDEIIVTGDLAIIRLTFQGTFTTYEDNVTRKSGGRHMMILQRQTDSSWKASRDISNNPIS